MSINKKKLGKFIGASVAVLGIAFVGMSIVAKKKKPNSVYDNEPEQKNPLSGKKVVFVEDENDKENADGVKGHLEAVGDSDYHPGFYDKYVKRAVDIVLSFGGLVALSPVFLAITVAIKIDDPGPVLFTQKRIGQNKEYFKLHKFRSMKMSTPHDVPTHMLENPDQYITRVGKFLRKHSLDELPQIWDIFIGNMSVIGPRPGLWNQDVLTAERDKYDANDVKPGLTGWAQINGRDELEIADKAKLDGEYVQKLGLWMDIKCFLGSLGVFAHDDSVVEGGTGEMKKAGGKQTVGRHYTDGKSPSGLIGQIGFSKPVTVDKTATKRVLITGAGSYIGESFKAYAETHYNANFEIDAVDMLDPNWRETDFSNYDIVYHVAGIAHADVGNVDDATKEKYYAVNTDLAVEVCRIAKKAGVKEFIFMSSMIVYGESAGYGKKKFIDKNTVPQPANFYGDSKIQADVAVRDLADENYNVIVLRPPMIYGKGSKGNYPMLAKLAKKLPVFPDVDNERSMLHIDNCCEFLCQIMLVDRLELVENQESAVGSDQTVVLFPQNGEWTKTSEMVQEIARISGKKIRLVKTMKPAVALGGKVPGKIGGLVNKAFGNSCYAQEMSEYPGIDYRVVGLKESIERAEGRLTPVRADKMKLPLDKYSVLMSVYAKDNSEQLEMAIESMLSQTMVPDQVVIVEDGPLTRALEDIICSYEKRYPQIITIVKLQKNGGLGNALNHGIKVCRNELIARMDADDISKPDRCQKQVAAFQANPRLDILGTQIDEFIGSPNHVISVRHVPTNYEEIKTFARRRSPFNHPTVMYRKSAIAFCGGYVSYGRKEDLDLFIRMVNEGFYAENLEESLLWYRTNEDNQKRRRTWINCKEYIAIMYKFYKKKYLGIGDMMYVVVGQMTMFLMPSGVTKDLSDIFLRDEKRVSL